MLASEFAPMAGQVGTQEALLASFLVPEDPEFFGELLY
jgi:hypothetical protein